MSVKVSKCGNCGGSPKAVAGEEEIWKGLSCTNSVKIKCTGCGISTGDAENVGVAVKQWENLFEKKAS